MCGQQYHPRIPDRGAEDCEEGAEAAAGQAGEAVDRQHLHGLDIMSTSQRTGARL